jgi:hypothetical protein
MTVAFNEAMNPATLATTTAGAASALTVTDSAGNNVAGTVSMNADNTAASFTPSAIALAAGSVYTATVSTAATNAAGTAMAAPGVTAFATGEHSTGQAVVNLRSAGSFAILTETGITDVSPSAINGDVGASPITGAAILLTCAEVKTGIVYSVNAAGPMPCRVTNASKLTTAIGDMTTAYLDAAGRKNPNFSELGTGIIGGLTLKPGLYKWSGSVSIPSNVVISGKSTDVWIFQVAGTLSQANATHITLVGGAKAKNVFWQVAGAVTIGTTAHFEGVLLAKTNIAVQTGASATARLLAQTAVTLQQNAITQPPI